jgi:hypothetical protein
LDIFSTKVCAEVYSASSVHGDGIWYFSFWKLNKYGTSSLSLFWSAALCKRGLSENGFFLNFFQRVYKEILKQISGAVALFIYRKYCGLIPESIE